MHSIAATVAVITAGATLSGHVVVALIQAHHRAARARRQRVTTR
jgi:hypothetical protein